MWLCVSDLGIVKRGIMQAGQDGQIIVVMYVGMPLPPSAQSISNQPEAGGCDHD